MIPCPNCDAGELKEGQTNEFQCTLCGSQILMRANLDKEPSDSDIQAYMERTNENFFNAREALREKAYGGKPPGGFSSWGDYWKTY